ncbi:EF-hand domain-containing protein [Pseudooceanicola sp. 502str34]
MKTIGKRIAGLALAIVASSPAIAQISKPKPQLPESLQGVWVLSENPDSCADPTNEFRVIGQTSDLLIKAQKEPEMRTFYTQVYSDVPEIDGWLQLSHPPDAREFIRLDAGKLISYYTSDDNATPSSAGAPSTFEGLDPLSYTGCDTAPMQLALPFAELITFHESSVLNDCLAGGETCIMSLFSFLDVAADGELRPAELARGMRIGLLSGLGERIATNGMDEQSYGMTLAVLPTLPLVGFSLAAQFDYDGSGGVSLQELMTDLGNIAPVLSSEADVTGLTDKIPFETLGQLPMLMKILMQ